MWDMGDGRWEYHAGGRSLGYKMWEMRFVGAKYGMLDREE